MLPVPLEVPGSPDVAPAAASCAASDAAPASNAALRSASCADAAPDALGPHRNPVEAALDVRLPALLADPEVPAADLARLLTAYAHIHRSQTARLKLLLSHAASTAEPPASESPPRPAEATAPGVAARPSVPADEITTHAGRPAPRRLAGYHPDAPFGRTPDGRPYTVDEFRAALRTAILANWGVDLPDDDAPDDAPDRAAARCDPDAAPAGDAARDPTALAARSHAADAAERQAPM